MAQRATISEIVLRYTQALYMLSEEQQLTDGVATELSQLCMMLDNHSILEQAFCNPVVSRRERVNLCRALAVKVNLSTIARNFVCLLAQKGRLNLLRLIEQKFQEFSADERGETKVEITSVSLLDDDITESLKTQLQNVTGKSVFIANKIDENIIAGLVVKIGSHMFDFSAQTRLRRIIHHMEGL
ncbi:MAG: ATP synthase F1 subunit delta [Alphaproteobacteria bacterium]|nr:ATP synthase F1 subunit delta [Alphaproteobacteria bacterium]